MIIDSLKYNGMCTCGKEHKMETEFCIIESGVLKEIKQYLLKYNLSGVTTAVYDENTFRATYDRHPDFDFEVILPCENLHADEQGVQLLLGKLPKKTEILIAIGSGTIHDIVRYVAYDRKVKFVSCPTAASVDGFCSSVAAMTWKGCKKTLTAVAPKIVVCDLDIIKNAPVYLSKSGFGDMIGKYIALTDWKISNILSGEFYCSRIAELTLNAIKSVVNSVEGILTKEKKAYEYLMYGLLLSGLSMQMIGNSRPASGAEHHISHIIEMEPVDLNISSSALHGEKVGVGTLLIAEEYKRISEKEDVLFNDYHQFSEDTVLKIFGADKSEEILKENLKDSAESVTKEILSENWLKICNEIKKIPDVSFLRGLYLKAEIKSDLSDIDIKDDMREKLFNYSPMVRNRLTLMRLRKCIL